MRNVLIYSLARLALLAGTVVIVWWIAGISLLSTIAAIAIATLLSILLLAGARRRATSTMAGWGDERRARRAVRRPAPAAGSDESIEDAVIEDTAADGPGRADAAPETADAAPESAEAAGAEAPQGSEASEGQPEREER